MKKLKFPDGFLWGAATSSHQIEGGVKNDWSEWEKINADKLVEKAKNQWQGWQQEKFPEMFDVQNYISGQTCDHYNHFEDDFDMAKSMSHNAHRFSIEWSRIEPEEGKFDKQEVEHYRRVLLALRKRGMEPFVTLWHWTLPIWLSKKGGLENKDFVKYFSRYVEFISDNLGKEVNFWITINEPMSVIPNGFLRGNWPPQKKNPILAWKMYNKLAKAHNEAYDILHKNNENSNLQVGFANILAYIEPSDKNFFLDRIVAKIFKYFSDEKFLKLTKNKNDFLALQYYFHYKVSFFGGLKNENLKLSDLGWEIYQEGMYHILKDLKKYNLPIYITENGVADKADVNRLEFIKDGLTWIYKAIKEGVDVRGYFYWSLLDNFEWDKGFWPRFGLIEIDYKTMTRFIRSSAWEYAKICKNNELEIDEK